VLTAFAMFVIDYGLLWVSRNQAQTSADAGALAGATALALDDFADRTATGPAKVAARSFALANNVWDAAPDVDMAADVRFYPDAPAAFPASCASDDCIRVDVHRTQARGKEGGGLAHPAAAAGDEDALAGEHVLAEHALARRERLLVQTAPRPSGVVRVRPDVHRVVHELTRSTAMPNLAALSIKTITIAFFMYEIAGR